MTTLTIDSLAHGGAGVGRADGLVYFVPFTAPGDKVKVNIISQKKNYAEAELVEILEASPHRVKPPCSVFGQCGGCQWQHVSYEEQLKQKSLIVSHALARIAKEEGIEIKPIIPSPDVFNYRNRAQFRSMGSKIGFYARKTHTLIEPDQCHIIEPALNAELQDIRKSLKTAPPERTSKFEVFIGKDGKAIRTFNKKHAEENGFSQVNTRQNENMVKYVTDLLPKPTNVDSTNALPDGNLLDLYCGNGNFSVPLNQKGWRVYGVDLSREAIHAARAHATPTTFFSAADCSLEVKKFAEKRRTFEAVLLDPPRVGADERIWKNLAALKPQKIIYVSCNPATFARDWARLKNELGGAKLLHVQPFDMFPQTFHVELVAYAETGDKELIVSE